MNLLLKSGSVRGLATLGASFAGFLVGRLALDILVQPLLKHWPKKRRNLLFNHAMSYVHAWISSVWVVSTFLTHRELWDDLGGKLGTSPGAASAQNLIAMSAGYFLYDMVDMYVRRLSWDSIGIWIHHSIVLSCFTSGVMVCKYGAYLSLTLLVELNGIFLHQRKLFLLLTPPEQHPDLLLNSISFRLNSALLLTSFIPLRFIGNWWLAWRVWKDRDVYVALSGRTGQSWCWEWVLGNTGMALINVYNIAFFRELWGSERKSIRNAKKAKKDGEKSDHLLMEDDEDL
ncbi:TLC domain-containing protein [Cladochytrium replicatum]|nr:TLC domain-containing protein [Cladochytrium replicatum]